MSFKVRSSCRWCDVCNHTRLPLVLVFMTYHLRAGCKDSFAHKCTYETLATPLAPSLCFVAYQFPEGLAVQRGEQKGTTDGVECWQETDATTFQVRSKNYMQNKKKEPSRGAIYK